MINQLKQVIPFTILFTKIKLVMKSLQNTFSILFFFIFLLIANVGSAQVVSNYIHNLGLTETQKQKSQEIRQDIRKQRKELYSQMAEIPREDTEGRKSVRLKIDNLTNQEEERILAILLVEQQKQYLANKEERVLEDKVNSEQRELARLESKYPNIEFTTEQITQITKKRQEIKRERFGYDTDGRKARREANDNIMKSELTDLQYAEYVRANQEFKTNKEAKLLAEIEKYEPIAEELLVIMEEFALPKYKKLRAKLEDKISNRDKAELADIRARRIEHFENELYSKMDAELLEIDNPELIYKAEQITQLVGSYSYIIGFMDESIARKEIQALVNRYDADVLNLKNELIWLNREIVLKGVKVVDKVYPIPFPEQMIPKQEELSKHEKRMFLLLDPAVDFSLDDWNSITKGEGNHQAVAYPSPARINQTLEFVTKESGKVTVEILDESGRVVRPLFSKDMNPGKQNINVSVSDLSPQIYFYRITTIESRTMLKFVVVK